MTRVALIPGGARGIGRAIALALADRGWSVAIAYRSSEVEAKRTCRAVESRGAAALAVSADVSDPSACARLVRATTDWKERVDALVQCVGPLHRADLLSETPEDWRRTFASNLDPLFTLSKLVAGGMVERRWGRIVAFGIANAERLPAQTHLTAYALAKAGVVGLVRSLARVLAPYQVTVNAISPGYIDTGAMDVAELADAAARIPAGRVGTPDDAAAVAAFLLSDQAGYVTGANIPVSGGWGV